VKPLFQPARPFEDGMGLHVQPLTTLLLQLLGPEYIDWDSEALFLELEERGGVPVGAMTQERIQAVRLMHRQPSFWHDWGVFENVTAAILGHGAVFSHAQPPDAHEIAIALDVARVLDASRAYSAEVLQYIVSALLYDGVWYLEEPLDLAQATLADHDSTKGILRDVGQVAAVLQRVGNRYITTPSTAAEVQANHVIEVRKARAEYNQQVQAQLRQLPQILQELR